MSRILLAGVFVLLVIGGALAYNFRDFLKKPSIDPSTIPQASPVVTDVDQTSTKDAVRVSTLVENLEIPWSLVFLPDNSILVTERPGRVRLVTADGKLQSDPVYTVSDVRHAGEGGLLGITIHPNFAQNRFVYIYYTYSGGESTLNRVVRFKFDGEGFSSRKVILDEIPGAANHNGGRIKFGQDGFLYITAGDAQKDSQAQDKNSLAGKVLRVTDEGGIPSDNPFGSPVYSLGHRNPQGLAWDGRGRLWETEHGPSSGSWPNCCQDELNRIEKGANYGWPDSVGDNVQSGTRGPVAHSGRDTWAPSGMAFLNGSIYFTGLRGALLMQAKLNGDSVSLNEYFKDEFGRLRDVVAGPDGLLYVLTNNTDGRGRPVAGDDKILVVNPEKL